MSKKKTSAWKSSKPQAGDPKGFAFEERRFTPCHPAAVSAESDLLKLTREFEELRSQLEANDTAVEALREEEREDNKQLRLRGVTREGQIAHLRRQRRVFETHFINVKELLSTATRPDKDCCDVIRCFETLTRNCV